MANLRPKVLNANGYDELLDDGVNIQLVAAPATDDAAVNREYVDTVAESLQGEIDSIVNPGGDPVYVRKAGDNMTGDLTLGTDKVTLNATNGNVIATGQLQSSSVIQTSRFGTNVQLAASSVDAFRIGSEASGPIKLKYDGSGAFSRQVTSTRYAQTSGLSVNYNGTDYGLIVYDQSELKAGITLEGAATFSGGKIDLTTHPRIILDDSARDLKVTIGEEGWVAGEAAAFTVKDQASDIKAAIGVAGSATFAGPLEAASIDGGSY